MKLILHYMKRYKRLLFLNIVAVFGFALVELGIPTIISDMIDQGVMRQDETYLMQMGFLTRTPRGRCVTRRAYEHLGLPFHGQEQLKL